MSRTLADADREIYQLRQSLAYLAECNAATAKSMPKAWSQLQKRRFISICQTSIKLCNGGMPNHYIYNAEDAISAAIERCEKAVHAFQMPETAPKP